jgi:hypothetical protein
VDGDLCGQPLASALASFSGGGGGGGGCALISSVDFLDKKSKIVENGTLQNLPSKVKVVRFPFLTIRDGVVSI